MDDILTGTLNIKLTDFSKQYDRYMMSATKEAGRHNFMRKLILPLTTVLGLLSLFYFIILLLDGVENMIFLIFAIMNLVIFLVFYKKAKPENFLREKVKAYIQLMEICKDKEPLDFLLCEVKTFPRVAYGLRITKQDDKGKPVTAVIWQQCLSSFGICESSRVETPTIDMENNLIIFPCKAL